MNYRKYITEPVGHTCPLIDEIISAVNSVSWDDTYWTAKRLIETLEEIRTANSTLREWGLDKAEDAMRVEDEKDELEKYMEKEITSLNDTISDLKNEISDLKNEISDLLSEIKELNKELSLVNV